MYIFSPQAIYTYTRKLKLYFHYTFIHVHVHFYQHYMTFYKYIIISLDIHIHIHIYVYVFICIYTLVSNLSQINSFLFLSIPLAPVFIGYIYICIYIHMYNFGIYVQRIITSNYRIDIYKHIYIVILAAVDIEQVSFRISLDQK